MQPLGQLPSPKNYTHLLQSSHPAAEGRLGLRRGGVRKDGDELPAEGRPIRLLQEVRLRSRPHDGGKALVSCTIAMPTG